MGSRAYAFFSVFPFFAFRRLLRSLFFNACIPPLHTSAYRAKNASIPSGSTTVLNFTLFAFFFRSFVRDLPSVARTMIGSGCGGCVSHSGSSAIFVAEGGGNRSYDTGHHQVETQVRYDSAMRTSLLSQEDASMSGSVVRLKQCCQASEELDRVSIGHTSITWD